MKYNAIVLIVVLFITALYCPSATAKEEPLSLFLSTAESEIGFIKSDTGISKYESAFATTEGEWSVSFLTWCAYVSDIPEKVFPHCSSADNLIAAFRKQGAFLSASSITPSAGTVAVLYTDATHTSVKVGLVTNCNTEKKQVEMITVAEQKEIVKVTYATDSQTIWGYCQPAYGLIDGYATGYYRLKTNVYFRKAPDTLSEKIYLSSDSSTPIQIPANTHLRITKVNNQWGYTTYNGISGWILLTFSEYIAGIGSVTGKSLLLASVNDTIPLSSFDFSDISVSGLNGLFIRLGKRDYSVASAVIHGDSSYASYAEKASEAGLHFGFCFESGARDTTQAEQEAQYCIGSLRSMTVNPDLPIFISLPDYSLYSGSYTMNKGLCSDILSVFCSTLENAGYYVGIHASSAVFRTYIASEITENRPLWLKTNSDSTSVSGDILPLSADSIISGCSVSLSICLCLKDYPNYIRSSGLNGFSKGDSPTSAEHTHIAGTWEMQIYPTCTTSGTKICRCTVPGCNVTVRSATIPATGHSTIQYVAGGTTEITAGEFIAKQTQSMIALTDDEKTTEGYEIIKNYGGSLISVCEKCGVVTKSIIFHPDTACTHALSLNEGTYTSSAAVYMRTGPATGYDKKQNEAQQTLYVKAGASFRLIFSMNQWGYIKCDNYYGWILLSYSTKIADNTYSDTVVLRNQACETDGLTALVCHQCKKTALTYLTDTTAHPHTEKNTIQGTCLVTGCSVETCTDCGAVLSYTDTGFGEHTYNCTVTVSPTAQMPGRAVCTCTVCNKSATVEIPILNMFDVTQDGAISSADARLVLRMSVKLEPMMMTQTHITRSDADGDGKITAADARHILRLSVHLTTVENLLVTYYSIS